MNSADKMNWMPIEHLQDRKSALFLVLLAFMPLLGFVFGSGNQVEQFAIIARMIDPNFAAGDFYVDVSSGFGPRFYYSKFMALIVGATSFPVAIIVLSLLCNLATGVLTYLSARRFLNASALAGAAAAIFAITNNGFALGLAGYIRFDSFQPASLAIPISLAGLYFSFSARSLIAAPLFAVASLFHPLIGVETGVISYGSFFLATIFGGKPNKEMIRKLLLQVGAGLIFVALVFAAWGVPSLASNAESIPDSEFFNALVAFRSPHHYLALGFPETHYVSFLFFCISAGLIMALFARAMGLTRESLSLIIAVGAVLILCALSVVFVDILETRIYATAQVFRMLILVKWIGYLFMGWVIARWVADHGTIGLILAALVLISTAEAQPRMFTFVLLLSWISTLKIFVKRPIYKWGLAAIAVFGLAFFHGKYGAGTEAIRATTAVGLFALLFYFPLKDRLAMAAAAAATMAMVVFININKSERWIEKDALTPKFGWGDLSGDDIDIARWVRDNTAEGIVWSTPPDFESFRLIAKRGIIVDFTSIPFGDLAMREWKARMATLYGPLNGVSFVALRNMQKSYEHADSQKLRDAMRKYNVSYAIIYNSTPWDGPTLYQNETYKAVQRAD